MRSTQPHVEIAPLELLIFVHGHDSGASRSAAAIAWQLEAAALHNGWLHGSLLGSERSLMERFGVSRAMLREAIRIVEARGSMRMVRGSRGGLYLIEPSLDHAVGALATYLRAHICNPRQLAEAVRIAEPLIATMQADGIIVRLYRKTTAFLLQELTTKPAATLRAPVIAMQLIGAATPLPPDGVALGSEADLCERFDSCRGTLRQALRVLDDLGMLKVRRGRGGGYSLHRPAEIGVIRQLFALLAFHHQTLEDTVAAVEALNLADLRLAAHRLVNMSIAERVERCEVLTTRSNDDCPLRRWSSLQRAIAHLADSPLTHSLKRCIVAYQGRLGRPLVDGNRFDAELRVAEGDIVHALQRGAADEAEQAQRIAQAYLSHLMGCRAEPGTHVSTRGSVASAGRQCRAIALRHAHASDPFA